MKLDTGAIGTVTADIPYWTKAKGTHVAARPINIHVGEDAESVLAFAAAIRESYAAHEAIEAALPVPFGRIGFARSTSDVRNYRSACDHAEPCHPILERLDTVSVPLSAILPKPKRRTLASVKAAVTDALRQLGDTGQDIGGFADGLRMALLIMED